MIRLTVEETLNALLDAEADAMCNAKCYRIYDQRAETTVAGKL